MSTESLFVKDRYTRMCSKHKFCRQTPVGKFCEYSQSDHFRNKSFQTYHQIWLLLFQNTFECPDVNEMGILCEKKNKPQKPDKEIVSKQTFQNHENEVIQLSKIIYLIRVWKFTHSEQWSHRLKEQYYVSLLLISVKPFYASNIFGQMFSQALPLFPCFLQSIRSNMLSNLSIYFREPLEKKAIHDIAIILWYFLYCLKW